MATAEPGLTYRPELTLPASPPSSPIARMKLCATLKFDRVHRVGKRNGAVRQTQPNSLVIGRVLLQPVKFGENEVVDRVDFANDDARADATHRRIFAQIVEGVPCLGRARSEIPRRRQDAVVGLTAQQRSIDEDSVRHLSLHARRCARLDSRANLPRDQRARPTKRAPRIRSWRRNPTPSSSV